MNNLPPNQPVFQEEESLDLKKYLFLILGNWYWFFLCLMISLGVSYMMNRYTKPVYKVSVSMQMKDETSRSQSGLESVIPGMEIMRIQKRILNEMEVLRSDSLTGKVIDSLDFEVSYVGVGRSGFKVVHLYHNAPYQVVPDSGKPNLPGHPIYVDFIDATKYRLVIDDQFDIKKIMHYGEKFESPEFNFTIYLRDSTRFNPEGGYAKNFFTFNSRRSLINQYKSKLQINTNDEKRGTIMFLSVSGYNAEQEVNYLNKLVKVYINQGLEDKNQMAVNTINFIDSQLDILNDSLQRAETNIQDFRLDNRLIDISSEGSLISQKLTAAQQQKSQIDLQERYFNYLQEYIRGKTSLQQLVAPSIVNVSDPLLTELVNQVNELIKKRAGLQLSVQEKNPALEQVNAQLEVLRQALGENIVNLLKNGRIAKEENKQLLTEVGAELKKLPVTERQFIGLQRKYKVNDQVYTYLLQKRAEAAVAKASSVPDNKVLDLARVENATRISPKTSTNQMLALLIGILFPLGIIILMEMLNNKISSLADIEKRTRVPIIGTVGHYDGKSEIPVSDKPRSSLAESFRGVRTNLQYLMREPGKKVISITSTISGEGKSFTSINLAAVFAMAGKKTLLLGLDLRKPKLWKVFNLDKDRGISTFLIGNVTFKETIYPSSVENLFVAPAGPVPPNPAELIGSPAMEEFLQLARKEFDILIIDTPPFGLVTDALIAGRLADVNLFVVRQMYSILPVIDSIDELSQRGDLPNIGLIMNDVKASGYYYHHGYRYYSYGYGYGYGYGKYNQGKYYSDDKVNKDGIQKAFRDLFKRNKG